MFYDRPTKKRGKVSYFVVALVAAIFGGLITAYIAPNYLYGKLIPMPEIYNQSAPESGEAKLNITPKDYSSVTAVAKKSISSVVGITTVQVKKDMFWEQEIPGSGSGVVVDPNGYILTNSHVVGDGKAKDINVLFENGDKMPGKILWNDPALDLAIVKVEATGLASSSLGDSDKLEVGELAVAIGNPLGLDFQRTVTSGVISGLNRTIKVDQFNSIEGLIQTDASINPGNSGGPLLNSKGEVIGINTVKIKPEYGEGLGFSIPANVAKPIVDQVIKEGHFETLYIGFKGMEVELYERRMGIELGIDKGIILLEIVPNGPVSKAGIKAGDILTKIDGEEVETSNQIRKILYKYKKGDKVKLQMIREGKEMEVEIILDTI